MTGHIGVARSMFRPCCLPKGRFVMIKIPICTARDYTKKLENECLRMTGQLWITAEIMPIAGERVCFLEDNFYDDGSKYVHHFPWRYLYKGRDKIKMPDPF